VTEPAKRPTFGANEQQLETALRALLGPLDRRLKYLAAFYGLAVVLVMPSVVYLFWQELNLSWGATLFGGSGVFLLLCLLTLPCEDLAVQVTVRAFDRRFPEGSPERALALSMLAEMHSPQKAGLKLHDALGQIVRRQPADPDAQIGSALDALAGTSPTPPAPSVPPEQAPFVLRSGGSYEYIPLEPRDPSAEDNEKGPPCPTSPP
jgi:hypothetical protein